MYIYIYIANHWNMPLDFHGTFPERHIIIIIIIIICSSSSSSITIIIITTPLGKSRTTPFHARGISGIILYYIVIVYYSYIISYDMICGYVCVYIYIYIYLFGKVTILWNIPRTSEKPLANAN